MKYNKIDSSLFIKNRKNFVKKLESNSIAFFNSNDIYPVSADSTLPFEELGWTEFATTNVPDADSGKFRSYEYDALDLEEFVGFAIKVVMQSKRTVEPCAIRAFRSIALA